MGTKHSCDGCCTSETPGVRPHATAHAGPPPIDYIVVERCDTCLLYRSDLEAAKAIGRNAKWQNGRGTMQAICQLPVVKKERGIIEIRINGDPYGSGFVGTQYKDQAEYDTGIGIYCGDIGARSRQFWRDYCAKWDCILRYE